MKKTIALLFLGLSLNLTAQSNETRFLTVSYFQKACFKDFKALGATQNQLLPLLSNNARMHGMELFGTIGDNIYVGLAALGTLNDNKNDAGYTSWGGATGLFTLEYRISKNDYFMGAGAGLGCGRFTYSTAFYDGSNSITAHVDGIFIEPKVKIGRIFNNKLVINAELSRIINISNHDYHVGSNITNKVFPKNLMVGLAIGYNFPYWKKKEQLRSEYK